MFRVDQCACISDASVDGNNIESKSDNGDEDEGMVLHGGEGCAERNPMSQERKISKMVPY